MALIRDRSGYQSLMAALPVEAAKRLANTMGRCEKGDPIDVRTPLYGKETPREVLISKLEESIGYTDLAELTGIDEHEKAKIGRFSEMLPWSEREKDAQAHWSIPTINPDMDLLKLAAMKICSILPARSLRLMELDTAYDNMPKGTSLGLPTVSSDKKYALEYLTRARSFKDASQMYSFIAYWRGQQNGLKGPPKQRLVWGADHIDTIRFGTILYPVLNALRSKPGFSAWLRASDVDLEATRLLKKARGKAIVSQDVSKFDASVPRLLLDWAGYILKTWFVESAHPVIDLAIECMATVGLVVPGEIWLNRNGGVPSGCVLTNLVDTLVNLLAGFYCALRNRTTLEDFLVLGDDSVFLYKDELSTDAISDTMSELNLDANPEKQFISRKSLHFLQRLHTLDYMKEGVCVGIHSPYRSANGLLGMERWHNDWNRFMYVARSIMQVENCEWDPRFPGLVTYYYNGDKVLSQEKIDPMVCFVRAGGSSKIRDVLHISSFPFNSKNPDLASKFKTVELIRRLQRGERIW